LTLPFGVPLRLAAGTYWVGLQFGGHTHLLRVAFSVSTNAGIAASDAFADGASSRFGRGAVVHALWAVRAVAVHVKRR
jgi:hypothetical protein